MSQSNGDSTSVSAASSEKPDATTIAKNIEGAAQNAAALSVELNKDNALFHTLNTASMQADVVKQLSQDGFSSFTLDKSGDIILNPSAPTQAGAPAESDFVEFAMMVSKMKSGDNVDAKDFAAKFGEQDAAVLNRLGLTNLSLQGNHIAATFAQGGEVQFGQDPLTYSNKVEMDLTDSNGTLHFANVKGLKGEDGGVTASISDIDIAPPNSAGVTDVQAKGKVAFFSKTVDEKVTLPKDNDLV